MKVNQAEEGSADTYARHGYSPGDIILTSGGGPAAGVIGASAWLSNAIGLPPVFLRPSLCMGHVATVTEAGTLYESTTLQTQPDVRTGERIKGVSEVLLAPRVADLLADGRKVYVRRRRQPWGRIGAQRVRDHFDSELRGKPYENLGTLRGVLRLADAEFIDHVFQTRKARAANIICSELSTIHEEVMQAVIVNGVSQPPKGLRNRSETSPTDFVINWHKTFRRLLTRLR